MTRLAFPFAAGPEGRAAAHRYGSPPHVREMVRLLILTMPGERVMRPTFGSPVRQMLFAGGNGIAAEALKTALEASLQQWLGHLIAIDTLAVAFDEATAVLSVDLGYRLKATGQEDKVSVQKRAE